MSEGQKQQLLVNLPRCKAQQTIHQGQYDPADYRAVYSLYLAAFGDEDLARDAESRAAAIYVEQAIRNHANQTLRER